MFQINVLFALIDYILFNQLNWWKTYFNTKKLIILIINRLFQMTLIEKCNSTLVLKAFYIDSATDVDV